MLDSSQETFILFLQEWERDVLIYFAGGGNYYHEYGRNMGWGHPNQHYFKCNSYFEIIIKLKTLQFQSEFKNMDSIETLIEKAKKKSEILQ